MQEIVPNLVPSSGESELSVISKFKPRFETLQVLNNKLDSLNNQFESLMYNITQPKLNDLKNYFLELKKSQNFDIVKIKLMAKTILSTLNEAQLLWTELDILERSALDGVSDQLLANFVDFRKFVFPDLDNYDLVSQIDVVQDVMKIPYLRDARSVALDMQAIYFARKEIEQLVKSDSLIFDPHFCGQVDDAIHFKSEIYNQFKSVTGYREQLRDFDFLNTPNDLYDHLNSLIICVLKNAQKPSFKVVYKRKSDPNNQFLYLAVPSLEVYGETDLVGTINFDDYFIPRIFDPTKYSFDSASLYDVFDKQAAENTIKTDMLNFNLKAFVRTEVLRGNTYYLALLSFFPGSFADFMLNKMGDQERKVLMKTASYFMYLLNDMGLKDDDLWYYKKLGVKPSKLSLSEFSQIGAVLKGLDFTQVKNEDDESLSTFKQGQFNNDAAQLAECFKKFQDIVAP